MTFTVRLLPLALIILALSLILGLGALAVGARVYGDELVYMSAREPNSMFADVHGYDLVRRLHVQRATGLIGPTRPPVWIPDGSGAVMLTGDGAISLLATGAHDLRPLNTELPRGALMLAYAPDGGRVAYTRIDADGYRTLHVRNMRTGSEAQITPDLTNAFAPTWSPDGRSLAFSWSPVANAEIYVVDADPDRSPVASNPRPRRLTFDYNLDTYPAWSPDGHWIAFVSDRDGNSEIYLMDAARGEAAEENDGRPVIRLTHDPIRNLEPQWSPDGRWISYSASQSGNLYLVETRCALHMDDDCTPDVIELNVDALLVWGLAWRPR